MAVIKIYGFKHKSKRKNTTRHWNMWVEFISSFPLPIHFSCSTPFSPFLCRIWGFSLTVITCPSLQGFYSKWIPLNKHGLCPNHQTLCVRLVFPALVIKCCYQLTCDLHSQTLWLGHVPQWWQDVPE